MLQTAHSSATRPASSGSDRQPWPSVSSENMKGAEATLTRAHPSRVGVRHSCQDQASWQDRCKGYKRIVDERPRFSRAVRMSEAKGQRMHAQINLAPRLGSGGGGGGGRVLCGAPAGRRSPPQAAGRPLSTAAGNCTFHPISWRSPGPHRRMRPGCRNVCACGGLSGQIVAGAGAHRVV